MTGVSMDTKAHTEGNLIVLDFATLPEALQLWKPWADARRRAEMTDMIHEALSAAGLGLEVRVQGKTVAHLGEPEKAGLILGLVGNGAAGRV